MNLINKNNELNDFEKYEVDVFDNKIKVNVATNNPVLREQQIYEISAKMSFENTDEMDFDVADFDGNFRINGHYTFMGGAGMNDNVIRLDFPTVIEIEKCVKRLFYELRKTAIEYAGKKPSCILFEHSTEESSCSYIPFISYEAAVFCMKNKYEEIKKKYHYSILEEESSCFNDNAKIVFNNGPSIVWQIVRC